MQTEATHKIGWFRSEQFNLCIKIKIKAKQNRKKNKIGWRSPERDKRNGNK